MRKLMIGPFLVVFYICSFGQTKIDSALKKELDSIYIEDQKLRNLISSELLQTKADSIAESFKIPKSELLNYIVKSIPIVDSFNFNRIELIIKQYGYPGKSLVGAQTNEAAYYVIQHSQHIDKYLPIIKEAADKKELPFKLYATMLDRSLMNKGKEQIYGTQGKGFEFLNQETGKKEFKRITWPIKNVSEVNDMRKKAGFNTTVEENAKQLGIAYKAFTLEEVNQMLGNISNPELKFLIDSLYQVDQRVQQDAIQAYQRSGSLDTFKVYEKKEFKTFERHIPLVKNIISKHGYPTFEKVGKESSNNFFILIQHSDSDVKFQAEILPIVKTQVEKKQVKGSNYAYLYDRIQINTGKEQLYGTQVAYDSDGNAFSKNLQDKENVNKRRSEFEMKPLEEYLQQVTELHKKQNQIKK